MEREQKEIIKEFKAIHNRLIKESDELEALKIFMEMNMSATPYNRDIYGQVLDSIKHNAANINECRRRLSRHNDVDGIPNSANWQTI